MCVLFSPALSVVGGLLLFICIIDTRMADLVAELENFSIPFVINQLNNNLNSQQYRPNIPYPDVPNPVLTHDCRHSVVKLMNPMNHLQPFSLKICL